MSVVTYIGKDRHASTFGSLEMTKKHVIVRYSRADDPPTNKDLILTAAREFGVACVPGRRLNDYGTMKCTMRIIA